MRLNPAAFDSFLGGNIGQRVNWRKGNPCPCFNPTSGAALPGHALCAGKGWIWDAPIDSKAGVTQQKVTREWAAFGQWEAGDAILTIPSSSEPMYSGAGRFDRIELLNSMDVFKLTLIRGQNDRILLPVVNFSRVFWLDPANNATIIEGGLPIVDAQGNLSWTAGEPPQGTQYSIAGQRYTDYFIWFNLPSDRNEHFGATLPKKLPLRRFDLFGR